MPKKSFEDIVPPKRRSIRDIKIHIQKNLGLSEPEIQRMILAMNLRITTI